MEGRMNQQKWLLLGGVWALSLTFTGYAAAADITYPVDDVFGGGAVTGSITTDGTLGLLFTGDIVSFDLKLTDAQGGMGTLMGPSGSASVFLSSGAVTATSTALLFDFSNTGQQANFFTTPAGSCTSFFTLRNPGGNICGVSGNVEAFGAVAGGLPVIRTLAADAGEVVFGGSQAAVPEPGSLGLLLVGAAGLIGRRRRLS
jgi:hypothetical protein